MNIMFSSLSPARQQLIRYMQQIQFGRIKNLPVVGREPQLSDALKLTKRYDTTRPMAKKHSGRDFTLKREHLTLMSILDEIGDGIIPLIKVSRGLPTNIEIEESFAG